MPDSIQVRWTEPATRDLEQIAEFIRADRTEAAERIAKSLFDTANSLCTLPSRGRIGKIQGTRELIVSGLPYIVVYRVTDAAVQILRIYHGARDWPEKS